MEGSQASGAILCRSFRQFSQRSGGDDLQFGTGSLQGESIEEGVYECIEASQEELSTLQQEELLRSASYGEQYVNEVAKRQAIAEVFPRTAKSLRILNALRCPEVGLYMTAQQYRVLGERAMIARLLARKQYYLAVKVCIDNDNNDNNDGDDNDDNDDDYEYYSILLMRVALSIP